MSGRGRIVVIGCAVFAALAAGVWVWTRDSAGEGVVPQLRLPADFEAVDTVLLPTGELLANAGGVFAETAAALEGHVKLLVLYSQPAERVLAQKMLVGRGVDLDQVRFVQVSHQTAWVRDYGPLSVEKSGGDWALVDADYFTVIGGRDDAVPRELAFHLRQPMFRLMAFVSGGNLLSNGQGLALATSRMLERNAKAGLDETALRDLLRRGYGIEQAVFLEPLHDEPTGHVDMSAAFVSSSTVVVGKADKNRDPDNAAILDRNAEQLSNIRTSQGPLQVVRVPMPPRERGVWRTYTNVLFAGGLLLVPYYPEIDPDGFIEAKQVFSRLLPEWRIVPIDCRALERSEGALRCVTLPLRR